MSTLSSEVGGLSVAMVAAICHAVNAGYCEALGDHSQVQWDEAPEWQRESVKNGVRLHLHMNVHPAFSHESWMREKVADGWVYGEVKDPEKKTHPCIVPFDQLPLEQQAKDFIFRAVVHALEPYVTDDEYLPGHVVRDTLADFGMVLNTDPNRQAPYWEKLPDRDAWVRRYPKPTVPPGIQG
jgi:hypothetical protein